MGWNGSGTFTGLHDWVQDQINSIKILASRHKAQDDVFIAGINSSLQKNGENSATGNMNLGTNRITNVGDGTAHTDVVNFGQIQDADGIFFTSTGSANTYVLTPAPAITAYTAGMRFYVKINATNTATSTINISTIGAKTIKDANGAALSGGELVLNSIYTLVYDGTDFLAISHINPVQSFVIAASDEETDLVTGTAKVKFRMPYAFELTAVRASVTTAPTGSVLTVDINETGTTILSTKLTIDATEKTSTTAATPAVISDSALADDAEMSIDLDGVGSTITGTGLKVVLIGRRT